MKETIINLIIPTFILFLQFTETASGLVARHQNVTNDFRKVKLEAKYVVLQTYENELNDFVEAKINLLRASDNLRPFSPEEALMIDRFLLDVERLYELKNSTAYSDSVRLRKLQNLQIKLYDQVQEIEKW